MEGIRISNKEYRERVQDLDGEEWRDVKGYEGWYQVSNLGRVKSLKRWTSCGGVKGKHQIIEREKILTPHISQGYRKVTLKTLGNSKHIGIYKLMAQAFIPNPENKPQVDHINRNRSDDRLENLRWVTVSENQLNSPRNVIVTHNGLTAPLTIHCRNNNIPIAVVKHRLSFGWDISQALTKPIRRRESDG